MAEWSAASLRDAAALAEADADDADGHNTLTVRSRRESNFVFSRWRSSPLKSSAEVEGRVQLRLER